MPRIKGRPPLTYSFYIRQVTGIPDLMRRDPRISPEVWTKAEGLVRELVTLMSAVPPLPLVETDRTGFRTSPAQPAIPAAPPARKQRR